MNFSIRPFAVKVDVGYPGSGTVEVLLALTLSWKTIKHSRNSRMPWGAKCGVWSHVEGCQIVLSAVG